MNGFRQVIDSAIDSYYKLLYELVVAILLIAVLSFSIMFHFYNAKKIHGDLQAWEVHCAYGFINYYSPVQLTKEKEQDMCNVMAGYIEYKKNHKE